MKKGNTKQQILEIALDLFSVNGYESTSMSDIATVVGIKKASLYAHFESKEEIFNSLITLIDDLYERNSLFSNVDFATFDSLNSAEELMTLVEKQIKLIVHDPHISKARKLFVIEQFQNKKIAKLQQKYAYDNIMDYGVKLIKYLIEKGVLKNGDEEVMAGELCLPISMWINMLDRKPSKENEIIDLIKRHIMQFFKAYQI